MGDFSLQMVLSLIVDLFLPSATEASVQSLTFPIERIKLYLQGVLLVSELFGDVSSVAPEREFV